MHRLMILLIALSGGAQANTWVYVDQGDCPGKTLVASTGKFPASELCTPAMAGKTALCFVRTCSPSCEYIDVRTPQCRGGAELAEVYTCVVEAAPTTP